MMATRATLWLVVLGLVCLAAVPGWGESLSGAKVRFVDSSSTRAAAVAVLGSVCLAGSRIHILSPRTLV